MHEPFIHMFWHEALYPSGHVELEKGHAIPVHGSVDISWGDCVLFSDSAGFSITGSVVSCGSLCDSLGCSGGGDSSGISALIWDSAIFWVSWGVEDSCGSGVPMSMILPV